jgi:hypothetical protein
MYLFRQGTRNTRENLVIRFWVKIISLSVAAALRVFDQTIMHDPANCCDETYWQEPMGSSACFHEIFVRTRRNCVACFSEVSANASDARNANGCL